MEPDDRAGAPTKVASSRIRGSSVGSFTLMAITSASPAGKFVTRVPSLNQRINFAIYDGG